MYEYIRGAVARVDATSVVIDIHGVGYRIIVPQPALGEASSSLQSKEVLCLFVDFIVREDAQMLYGFLSEFDRSVFRVLTSVSGIGPKSALQMMNRAQSSEILRALSERDVAWLSSLPGVGKKTAERLSVEASRQAQDIAQSLDVVVSKKPKESEQALHPHVRETLEALISLGLSSVEAKKCVHGAISSHGDEEMPDVSRLIHMALVHRKKTL